MSHGHTVAPHHPTTATVAVALTHYNRPEKLGATLESLAGQTRPPDVVFLYDDCSPKDPTEVARAFAARFRRFSYVRQPANLGMPGNLNAAVRAAVDSGADFVANLHDADTFHPTLLEKWERALLQHPSAGMVFCGTDGTVGYYEPGKGRVELPDAAPLTPGREFFDRWFVGATRSVIWGTVMVRAAVYRDLLPFDPAFRNWADVDMWMRICAVADIAYVREPLILLDNTYTPQRAFSWERFCLLHEMVLTNILRAGGSRTGAASASRARHLRVVRRRILRHVLASVARGDGRRALTGLKVALRWRRRATRPAGLRRGAPEGASAADSGC